MILMLLPNNNNSTVRWSNHHCLSLNVKAMSVLFSFPTRSFLARSIGTKSDDHTGASTIPSSGLSSTTLFLFICDSFWGRHCFSNNMASQSLKCLFLCLLKNQTSSKVNLWISKVIFLDFGPCNMIQLLQCWHQLFEDQPEDVTNWISFSGDDFDAFTQQQQLNS